MEDKMNDDTMTIATEVDDLLGGKKRRGRPRKNVEGRTKLKPGRRTELVVDQADNGAANFIEMSEPYVARIVIQGTADFLFHRWNAEAVDEKARSAKGSRARKTDDLESFVFRDEKGILAIPGEYLRQSVIQAARFKQDPRSPRKSLMDLAKAAVISLTRLAPVGKRKWDYEDKRRVVVQRNGINRTRPALKEGWQISVHLQISLPEYFPQSLLLQLLNSAGRIIGIGDNRPTFGRFAVVKFDVLKDGG
jgi:hypothetical protein